VIPQLIVWNNLQKSNGPTSGHSFSLVPLGVLIIN
jgi:hypothetical protein